MKKLALIIVLVLFSISGAHALDLTSWGKWVIRSVTLVDGNLEVVETKSSGLAYPEGGSPPHTAKKTIYTAVNGKIVMQDMVTGYYYPESYASVPEKYSW